jgi:hypothetical protein
MAAGWRVVQQRAQDELTPAGTFEAVWVVTYVTDPEGITGSVKVPGRLYTEEYVRDAIENIVARNKAVANL